LFIGAVILALRYRLFQVGIEAKKDEIEKQSQE
jgi:hypothetical protein